MADPAWGTTSTDEETARALCAFQHMNPLPIKRSEVPQLSPALGLAAFGYPTHGSFHQVPMSVRRDEAASVLVGMHAPSTVGDDWKQSQQRSIQEQIEQQQRELQVQTQQQQQRVMEAQLHHVQTQIQQQMQAQRIQQPRYASGAGEFEQMRWAPSRTGPVATPSFGGGDNVGQGSRVQTHRPGQLYDGGFQSGQQMKPTTATPSYASSYRATSASDGRFQPRQVQQPTQSRLFATSAPQQWGKQESSSTSLSGSQADRTRQFQMHTTQRVMPQQSRQPQPYYPHGVTARQPSSFRPDNAVVNGLTRYFSNAAGPAAGIPSNRAPAGSDPGYIGPGDNNFRYNPAQAQVPAPAKVPMYVQTETQSRPVVPPSGIPVVPGVSLAPPPLRLVTMRDLLNSDDGPTKTNASRGRPRGGKKQRAPPKRPAPKKKRQRMPQQQSDRAFQRPTSRIGNLLPNPSTSLAPTGSSPPTPMYLAFMESRAARALEQTTGITMEVPPIAPTPGSQSQVPTPATQLSTSGAFQNQDRAGNGITVKSNPVKRKRGPYKKKKVDAPQKTCVPTGLQHSATAANAGASLGKQTSGPVPWMETKSVPNVYERNASLSGLPHSVGVSDFPMGGDHDQRQPAQLLVPQASLTLETSQNGKVGTTPKKRRKAKLPRAGSTFPAIVQQVPTALSAPPAVTGSSATNTAVPAVVAQALAGVSEPSPVANRTVIIFCKRDFMRYQAAKIWRKYQEQLKKQGEWREVRVAGKRTRYLNSRYDDEIRRTHRKTYTRSGKPRKTATQQSERSRGDKQSSSTANPVLVGSTSSSSALLLTQDHENSSPARKPHEAVDSAIILTSGGSTNASGDHSSDEKLLLADEATTVALQEQSPRTEEGSKRVVLRSISSEPSDKTVSIEAAAKTHPEPRNQASDGNEATCTGNRFDDGVIADASADGNLGEAPKSNLAVPDEARERGDVILASESSHESAEATKEVEMEAAGGEIMTSGALTDSSGTHSSDEKSIVADTANPAALHEQSLRTEEETHFSVVRSVSNEPSIEPVGTEVEAKMHAEPSNVASDGDEATGAGSAIANDATTDGSADGGTGNITEVPEGDCAVPDEACERGDVIITSEPSHGSAEVNELEIKDGVDTAITDTPNGGSNVAIVDASCSNGVEEIMSLAPDTALESTAVEAVSVDVIVMNNPASDSNVDSVTETSGTIEEYPQNDTNSSSGEIEPKSSPADAPEQSATPAKDEKPSSNCDTRDDSPSG